jgi:hypothetical protein
MELYNVRNIARQGIERGDPGEKNMPRMVKFRKQQFRFEYVIFKQFHIKRNKIFSFEDLEKQTKVTSHLGKTETIKSEWVNTISTLIIILAAILFSRSC